MKKGLIFDLDGTLWSAIDTVLPVWNRTIKDCNLGKIISYNEMCSYMGKRIEEIAKLCFPKLSENKRIEILKRCCYNEQSVIQQHGGVLYPGLEETLESLKEKYHLYIVSNCSVGYIENFLNFHKLNRYFEDYEMAGRTGKSKGENIKMIIQRNNLDRSAYIGDTQGDCDGAKFAGIPFIFAEYGFGSVDNYDYKISTFADLLEISQKAV